LLLLLQVIHMLFIQGVYNVITGNYPTGDKDAITLAALQFQARFGPHNPSSHKPGFLSTTLVEYIPTAHLMLKPPAGEAREDEEEETCSGSCSWGNAAGEGVSRRH